MSEHYTILIADDSAAQRKVLELFLKDYSVLSAEDGQDALELLETCEPHLFIFDVNMPFVKGTDLCQQVKAQARFKNTPVIILTSQNDPETRNAVETAQADLLMIKPVSGSSLKENVARLLN